MLSFLYNTYSYSSLVGNCVAGSASCSVPLFFHLILLTWLFCAPSSLCQGGKFNCTSEACEGEWCSVTAAFPEPHRASLSFSNEMTVSNNNVRLNWQGRDKNVNLSIVGAAAAEQLAQITELQSHQSEATQAITGILCHKRTISQCELWFCFQSRSQYHWS